MEWYIYLLIVVAGFIAGFINTLAGQVHCSYCLY